MLSQNSQQTFAIVIAIFLTSVEHQQFQKPFFINKSSSEKTEFYGSGLLGTDD